MRHQLQEVEVVHFVIIASIYVIVYQLHHIEICVVVCAKPQQNVNMLGDLSEGQRFQDVCEFKSIELIGMSSLEFLDQV